MYISVFCLTSGIVYGMHGWQAPPLKPSQPLVKLNNRAKGFYEHPHDANVIYFD